MRVSDKPLVPVPEISKRSQGEIRLRFREILDAHRTTEETVDCHRGRSRTAGIAGPSGAQPATSGAARAGRAGVCRGSGQSDSGAEVAMLGGHGGQVACPLSEGGFGSSV